jgi:hypothetical protein
MHLRRDGVHHVPSEVVEDVAAVTRERFDERPRIGLVPKGERREVKACGPTLGSVRQTLDVVGLELRLGPLEEFSRLGRGEAKILCANSYLR